MNQLIEVSPRAPVGRIFLSKYDKLDSMDKLSSILINRLDHEEKNKYISQEFQDYGIRLAAELGEENRKAMYIKLAKTKPRAILEQARSYVIDYPRAKSKGKLFLWKVKDLESKHQAEDDKKS